MSRTTSEVRIASARSCSVGDRYPSKPSKSPDWFSILSPACLLDDGSSALSRLVGKVRSVNTSRPLDLTAMTGPSTVLVTTVALPLMTSWPIGPLPIVQPSNETAARRGHAAATDGHARRTLVAPQQADVLYGDAGLARRHLIVDTDAQDFRLLALEQLTMPAKDTALLAVHLASKGDRADYQDLLAETVHSRASAADRVWPRVREAIGQRSRFALGSEPPKSISFTDGVDDALVAAYALITAVESDRMTDLNRRAAKHSFTIESTDWSALVLRDGAAFVGHQISDEAYAPTLRTLVHSVHLDALLLAMVQRMLVDASGALAVKASLDDPSELVKLERDHFDFKRTYWRTSLTTKRTSPCDIVLRAFQDQLLTQLDVTDVEERVQDGARLAQSLHSQHQERAQRTLNRMVQRVSVIFGAFGLAFAAAPVVDQPSWSLFLVAAAVGLVGMGLAFLVLWLTGHRT